MAPEALRETARQHPRAVPVISQKHVLSCPDRNVLAEEKERADNEKQKEINDLERKPISPTKTLTEAVTEKLAPAYATVSGVTQAITSKIQGLTASAQPTTEAHKPASPEAKNLSALLLLDKHSAPETNKPSAPDLTKQYSFTENNQKKLSALTLARHSAPATNQLSASILNNNMTAAPEPNQVSSGEQIWDKGVSVKEYIMQKLEPGEDERALSQVISQAMSQKKSPGDVGVVDRVKEAVTSLIWTEESKHLTVQHSAMNQPSKIPISTNAPEVGVIDEEKNHIRKLQAN